MISSAAHWLWLAFTLITSVAAVQEDTAGQPGLLIRNKPGTWYSLKVSNPVVLQLGPQDYRMWAYGREVGYQGSPGVSFGRTGYFKSKDGIKWTPVEGPSMLGSVMSPNTSCGLKCFDSGDVGVTSVVPSPSQGVFYQWYMGIRQTPNNDPTAFGLVPATRGGVAVSYDGINWITCYGPKPYGSWLEADPSIDSFMFLMTLQRLSHCKHPRHVAAGARMSADVSCGGGGSSRRTTWQPWKPACNEANSHGCAASSQVPNCQRLIGEAQPDGSWTNKHRNYNDAGCHRYHMFYNSIAPINGSIYRPVPLSQLHVQLFGAIGRNEFEFSKTGAVQSLAPSADPAAFDSFSSGSARVLASPTGEYLLFYEGANLSGAGNLRYSIGLARSKDGITWHKDTSCTGTPGGPVLFPGNDSSWDYTVGTPSPVLQPDGRILLYYVGFYKADASQGEESMRCQIGLAIGHVSNPCRFVKYVYLQR